ncbi:hypothetical protein K7640_10940 [Micromonospora sp. PLK6-60]|uniref:hypothetical protein n=1 Tax=Micromonospora sp. PLK6-60 TaxID=2873383 RepID=UPI001CA61523|nr:hypothetical protein [Micromonospora sp. PLK6-60]MBY8872355.1 hypothetical protein [Micromonospora sp. PLK6-60]
MSGPHHALRYAWRGSCLLVLVVVAGLVPAPASAHPFGAPQQIEVAGQGDRGVRVRWLAGGTDDLTLLGIALGVLPEDRVMLDGAVSYRASDAEAVAGAPEFARYLTERIAVVQDGRPCPGRARVGADLAGDGAEVAYTCPAPVGTVTVTSRMLTDLHTAYRTLASGPDGQKTVYDAAHESADWTFGPGGGSVRSATRESAWQLAVAGGAVLVAVVAGVLWRRRRGRRG